VQLVKPSFYKFNIFFVLRKEQHSAEVEMIMVAVQLGSIHFFRPAGLTAGFPFFALLFALVLFAIRLM
jgi:hypothetical protein